MAEVELQSIGNYAITRRLAESSTGDFYLGTKQKKTRLIKKFHIPLTQPDEKKAFLTRTKQLSKLRDRSIIEILDSGFVDDYGYIVMEQLTATSLSEHIQPGTKINLEEAKRYLSPLATALHNAHLRHIIHGNLQPGNVLLNERDEPVLGGFALTLPPTSIMLDDEQSALPYMAPEHLQGQPQEASDQYSLAVMLFEWLGGQRPYPQTDREELLAAQLHTPLPSLHTLNKHVSEAVEQVIRQALAIDPEQRFQNTQDLATAYLNALLHIPFQHQPDKKKVVPFPIRKVAETPPDDLPAKDTRPVPASTPVSALASVPVSIFASAEEQVPILPVPIKRQLKEQFADLSPDDRTAPLDQKTEIDQTTATDRPTIISDSKLAIRVEDDLRQGGVLSQSLPGYEERPAQIEMATLVSRAITNHAPAIIEAATGTGKSLAYLVPVVRSGQVAIVSTANKALQEQLYYKDIPFIQKHIKRFEAALVKGISNYICLDKVESERATWQIHTKDEEFQRLYDFLGDEEAMLDFSGDLETLKFRLPSDIRGRIAADSDQCAWSKCEFFEDCFVHQMRQRAEAAQVIVVNHTLLLLDAAMGGFLLPERDMIIIDEAHHLEEEATRSFTITVTAAQVMTLLAQRMLKDHSQMSLQNDTQQAAQQLWRRLEEIVPSHGKGRVNLDEPIEEGLHLATVLSDLTDSLRRQRPKNLPDKEGQLYDKLLKRAQNLAENVRKVFAADDKDKFVYYIEQTEKARSRESPVQASAAPLDITSWLKERLFDKCNVISTSATLATVGSHSNRNQAKGPNFSYFRHRVGLDEEQYSNVLESVLPLTFDYEKNALLYVPRHLSAPAYGAGSDDYMTDIAREMYRLVIRSRGRAFLLFSSRRILEHAYKLMAPHLEYPLLKQGESSRIELTRRFRSEEGAILFGLKSFWEGVDIAGDALSLVVIDKLPFDPPDDPVHEARVARMKAAGENWFGTYVLPQAVLRLKQGIGRLLRSRQDRGVMAILDTRLYTKGYGRMVLDALPPARRTSDIHEVKRFFDTAE